MGKTFPGHAHASVHLEDGLAQALTVLGAIGFRSVRSQPGLIRPIVEGPRRKQTGGAGAFHTHVLLGQQVLERLECPNRLTELMTGRRVVNRERQCPFHDATHVSRNHREGQRLPAGESRLVEPSVFTVKRFNRQAFVKDAPTNLTREIEAK